MPSGNRVIANFAESDVVKRADQLGHIFDALLQGDSGAFADLQVAHWIVGAMDDGPTSHELSVRGIIATSKRLREQKGAKEKVSEVVLTGGRTVRVEEWKPAAGTTLEGTLRRDASRSTWIIEGDVPWENFRGDWSAEVEARGPVEGQHVVIRCRYEVELGPGTTSKTEREEG
jgi:hypothetical protein